MSPQILGYMVLVYAAFTSSVVLRVGGYALGRWDIEWWVPGDAAIWLAFVLGGSGLVLGRAWGRLVVVVAAAAAIVEWIVAMVLRWKADIPQSEIDTLALLIPVSIIVGALSVPAFDVRREPSSSGQIVKRTISPHIDLSYGCFAWIAFVPWIEGLGSLLPISHSSGQALLMLISIPVGLGTIAAALIGIVLSVVGWREWPLLAMSLVVVLMIVVFLVAESGSFIDRETAFKWYVGSSAILAFFCVRWFAFSRKRLLHGQATG